MAPRGARKNTLPATWGPVGQARRGDPRARSAAAARSRTGRREPAVRQGSLRAPAVRGRRHGLTAALRGSRSTRRDRPGSGTHHTAPCCGRRCAAMLAAIAPAHLAQTLRQRLRGPSPRRPLEAPAHSAVSCPATHGWYDVSPEQTGTTERPQRRAGICTPFRPSRCAHHPQSGFSRGGRGAERSAWSFRWRSGMQCRADSHSRLPAELTQQDAGAR